MKPTQASTTASEKLPAADEVARRIEQHLKRYALCDIHHNVKRVRFYRPMASPVGIRGINILYIGYQSRSNVALAEARLYLDWLDRGGIGDHHGAKRAGYVVDPESFETWLVFHDCECEIAHLPKDERREQRIFLGKLAQHMEWGVEEIVAPGQPTATERERKRCAMVLLDRATDLKSDTAEERYGAQPSADRWEEAISLYDKIADEQSVEWRVEADK